MVIQSIPLEFSGRGKKKFTMGPVTDIYLEATGRVSGSHGQAEIRFDGNVRHSKIGSARPE
jgi:hypothetical protein